MQYVNCKFNIKEMYQFQKKISNQTVKIIIDVLAL